MWRDSQAVRPRSATPSSPVRIRFAPLQKGNLVSIMFMGFPFLVNRSG